MHTKKSKYKVKKIVIIVVVCFLIILAGFYSNPSSKGLRSYEREQYVIYYKDLEDETLADMATTLDGISLVANEFFGEQDDEKTEVIVYKNVDEFQRSAYGLWMSLYLEDWAVGASAHGKLLVTSPENPDSSHNYNDMLEVLAHEYIHHRLKFYNDYPDIWLDEGAAIYFANQKQTITDFRPSFEEMASQDLGSFVEAEGYTYSYYYFEYLYQNFEHNQVIELIKTNDYVTALGRSKEVIYKEYKNYLDSMSDYIK